MIVTSIGGERAYHPGRNCSHIAAVSHEFRGLAAVVPKVSSSALRKRAYGLARSGACKTLVEISNRLKLDGFSIASIGAFLEQKTCADLTRIMTVADMT